MYKQLTLEERYQIKAYIQAGFSISKAATALCRHKSTVSREIKRNSWTPKYNPSMANEKAVLRKKYSRKAIRLTSEMEVVIRSKLLDDWSPEQISGYFKCRGYPIVSHETIYQYIYKDKIAGGSLFVHLRQGKKKRSRYGSKRKRMPIKKRISIDKRPQIVEQKSRIGDWEFDLVIGKNHKGVLITMVERKSKFTLIRKAENKNSKTVSNAIIETLSTFTDKIYTGTFDNGGEFAKHDEIAKTLGMKVFFAHPYSSWERGLNENTNGLIRQYFPKKTSFEQITDAQISGIVDKLNQRPRKTLGYATPNQLFYE